MSNTQTKQYSIVFCDIDGTLIDSQNRISNGTKQKIQELCSGGVPFVLVSARMPSGIAPLQRELGVTMPMICYSGALVLDKAGSCLKATGMSREAAAELAEFIQAGWHGISCNAFYHNTWLTEDIHNSWVVREQEITGSVPEAGTILGSVAPGGQIHKLLCMGPAEEIADLNRALREKFPALAANPSKATYLEIMDGAASKSGALEFLCRQRGIPVEAAVSFGDGFNDVDMLRATGMSFAMGNAPEEVKRHARCITLDNDHEGVLAGLKQLDFAKNRF